MAKIATGDTANDLIKKISRDTTKDSSSGFLQSTNWVAVFRLEKNGRGGKTVTVIDQLPKQEIFLRDLCKELKSKCGSGGTYSLEGKEGVIEIQGDKRDAIKAIFTARGYRFKGM
jgi:translation initiation factor 1